MYPDNEMPEGAVKLVREYCDKRIQAKLVALPDFAIQEQMIGYLAQVDLAAAQDMLRMWLKNSRSPCVSDAIKHHPDFRGICETTQYGG